MIDERSEELASLYALDLLEGAERTAFETAVAADPALAQLVAELREAAASIAHTAPTAEPPSALKARVLATAIQSKIENPKSKITADLLPPFPRGIVRIPCAALFLCRAVTA